MERSGSSTRATRNTFPCPSMTCKPGWGPPASLSLTAQRQVSLSIPSRLLLSRSHRLAPAALQFLFLLCTTVAKLASLYCSMACLSPKQSSHACMLQLQHLATNFVKCHMSLHACAFSLEVASAGCASPSLNSTITQSSPCQACVA